MKIANTKKAMVGITLVLTLLFVGGSLLHAHMRPHLGLGLSNPEEHAAWIKERLTKELNLDASQQQELETMVQDLLDKGRAIHELRKTSRQEVLSMLRENSVDRQRMENLKANHLEEISGFVSVAGDRLTDFMNMLTAEQKQRLANAIEKHEGCPHFHSE